MKNPVLNGQRLKSARRLAGLRQQGLAALLGTSQSHISSMERGTRAPSVEMLKALANALGVSVHWLCGEEDLPSATPPALAPAGILADASAAPGLLALAADARLVASLEVKPAEWGTLYALRPPAPLTKQGYLAVLIALRTNVDKSQTSGGE